MGWCSFTPVSFSPHCGAVSPKYHCRCSDILPPPPLTSESKSRLSVLEFRPKVTVILLRGLVQFYPMSLSPLCGPVSPKCHCCSSEVLFSPPNVTVAPLYYSFDLNSLSSFYLDQCISIQCHPFAAQFRPNVTVAPVKCFFPLQRSQSLLCITVSPQSRRYPFS